MDHFVTRSVLLLAMTITLTSLSISPVSARPFYEALVTDRLRDWQLARLVSRSNGKRLARSREVHPICLGLGQEAAIIALDTIAMIEQEDKRRKEEERLRQEGSNPIRNVG